MCMHVLFQRWPPGNRPNCYNYVGPELGMQTGLEYIKDKEFINPKCCWGSQTPLTKILDGEYNCTNEHKHLTRRQLGAGESGRGRNRSEQNCNEYSRNPKHNRQTWPSNTKCEEKSSKNTNPDKYFLLNNNKGDSSTGIRSIQNHLDHRHVPNC